MKSRHDGRRRGRLVEQLEMRELLNGVTVITHGLELTGGTPGESTAMASAIAARAGAGTAIYKLTLNAVGGNPVVTSFTKTAGFAPTDARNVNAESVIFIDWSAVSGANLFTLTPDFSAQQVAHLVTPYLTSAQPAAGVTVPLAQGPVQLIGHSRGAAFNTQIARELAQAGVWVDQFTALDPRPVPPDIGVTLGQNVVFADDYFQTSGDGLFVPNGFALNGAANFGPLHLGGAYSDFIEGGTHSDVHLYYHGTIDLSANASDSRHNVVASWYPNNGANRATTGFYYSRIGRGARPASGVSSLFGGSGARTFIATSGVQWPNIGYLTLPAISGPTLRVGTTLAVSYRYNSPTLGSNINFFFDTDMNPYDGFAKTSTAVHVNGGVVAPAVGTTGLATAGLTAGTNYFIVARITDGTRTRFAYLPQALRFDNTAPNPTPIGAFNSFTATALVGWAIDPNAGGSSQVRYQIDNNAPKLAVANIDRPDLAGRDSSTLHGFSIALPHLSAGTHVARVWAVDSSNSQLISLGARTLVVANPGGNTLPVGMIGTNTNATQVVGWAFDADSGAAAVQVRVDVDGVAGTPFSANLVRPELAGPLGSTLHGFKQTLSLSPGPHRITVMMIDNPSGTPIFLGSRIVGSAAPQGLLGRTTATTSVGWLFNPAFGAAAVTGRLKIDGTFLTNAFVASLPRTDINFLGSVNHGFSVTIPTLIPGLHTVTLQYIDPMTLNAIDVMTRTISA